MKKYFGICILALVVVCFTFGSAFAGTITQKANSTTAAGGPLLVAKEIVMGAAATGYVASIGDNIKGYTPTTITLGSLVDPVLNLKVATGKLTVVGVVPQLCTTNTAPSTVIANYSSGSATDTLVFQPVSGQSISNNVKYYLGKTNCTADLGANDITATFLPAETSVGLTITTGSSSTQVVQDTATATLLSAPSYEWSATVTTAAGSAANKKIDPTALFKKFQLAGTTDTIVVTVASAAANLDIDTVPAAGDVNTFRFTLTDVSGLAATSVTMGGGYTCALSLTTKIATCTLTGAAAAAANTATFTVDGVTALAERTFTADAEITFATALTKARTVALGTALLQAVSAGSWVYDGRTIYVPLVRSSAANGVETYIKLQSSDTTTGANGISAVILASDGTLVTASMGSIVAGTPFTISGADLVQKVTDASKTVNGNAGFAVKLNVYSADKSIYGYANLVDATGAKRIPISTTDGITN